jgi:hypothetical protein
LRCSIIFILLTVDPVREVLPIREIAEDGEDLKIN